MMRKSEILKQYYVKQQHRPFTINFNEWTGNLLLHIFYSKYKVNKHKYTWNGKDRKRPIIIICLYRVYRICTSHIQPLTTRDVFRSNAMKTNKFLCGCNGKIYFYLFKASSSSSSSSKCTHSLRIWTRMWRESSGSRANKTIRIYLSFIVIIIVMIFNEFVFFIVLLFKAILRWWWDHHSFIYIYTHTHRNSLRGSDDDESRCFIFILKETTANRHQTTTTMAMIIIKIAQIHPTNIFLSVDHWVVVEWFACVSKYRTNNGMTSMPKACAYKILS